jgi:hypothetical protein
LYDTKIPVIPLIISSLATAHLREFASSKSGAKGQGQQRTGQYSPRFECGFTTMSAVVPKPTEQEWRNLTAKPIVKVRTSEAISRSGKVHGKAGQQHRRYTPSLTPNHSTKPTMQHAEIIPADATQEAVEVIVMAMDKYMQVKNYEVRAYIHS